MQNSKGHISGKRAPNSLPKTCLKSLYIRLSFCVEIILVSGFFVAQGRHVMYGDIYCTEYIALQTFIYVQYMSPYMTYLPGTMDQDEERKKRTRPIPSHRPIRLTQCCTQFKSFGNKTFCSKYFHII